MLTAANLVALVSAVGDQVAPLVPGDALSAGALEPSGAVVLVLIVVAGDGEVLGHAEVVFVLDLLRDLAGLLFSLLQDHGVLPGLVDVQLPGDGGTVPRGGLCGGKDFLNHDVVELRGRGGGGLSSGARGCLCG